MRNKLLFAIIAATILIGLDGEHLLTALGVREAGAVIGRPLTPVSYAGVARRTARRTTRRNLYGAAYPTGVVTALPAGCGFATGIYTCGAVRYRPYYDGPTVVYQEIH